MLASTAMTRATRTISMRVEPMQCCWGGLIQSLINEVAAWPMKAANQRQRRAPGHAKPGIERSPIPSIPRACAVASALPRIPK